MEGNESAQSWIDALKRGDEEAAQRLFEEYFLRLVGLARKKLQALAPCVADPSGVVQSAMNSFFQGARRNAFPRLNDKDDLWRLLVVITARKAAHVVRDERRQKRGGGNVRGESAFGGTDSSGDFQGLDQVLDGQPTAEMAAAFAEDLQQRLDALDDGRLREIARMKLQGYTNAEIAEKLQCVPRTVERKLGVIRTIWEHEE